MKRIVCIVCCLVGYLLGAGVVQGHEVVDLQCEHLASPIGVVAEQPRFAWKVRARRGGYQQQAYQVMVATSEEALRSGGVVWNSGRVESAQSVLVPYGGAALKPATTYYWRVRTWSTSGRASRWSAVGRFVTGLPTEEDWQGARWIAPEEDRERVTRGYHGLWEARQHLGDRKVGDYRMPMFRKQVAVERELHRATAFVCGLGHFDLFVNGRKVSDHFLDAGWTHYSHEALYVGFDVTRHLLRGDNVVGVMLGNGFYNIPYDGSRYFKQFTSFGAPKLKMMLRLEYADGSVEHVVTDGSWRVSESPITFSSIYGGEDYDARMEQHGWNEAGFAENHRWEPAKVVECDLALRPQMTHPMAVRQVLDVVRTFRNAKGNWVYDFGQNFSGIIRVELMAEAGERIVFRPAELLNPDSTVNQSASGDPYYFTFTAGDEGSTSTWQPQFSYYGFRYVEVEGAVPYDAGEASQPRIRAMQGLHVCNAAPEVGSFRCSNPLFNDIHQLIDWAIRSNMASVLTDCPHREKLGWLEETHLMQPSVQYRYDVAALYDKIFGDMAASQRSDGCVPSIAPEYIRFGAGFEDSPEWGSSVILAAWQHYRTYGDLRLMADHYTAMCRYVGYLWGRASDGIVDYGLGDWFDIGPNPPGVAQLTSKALTATAYLYLDLKTLQQIASLLGRSEDAATYEERAACIRHAFRKRFLRPEKPYVENGSQTACALALFAGLLDPAEQPLVMAQLVADIRGRGNALTAGDVGYRYVLKTLAEGGRSDVVYDMNSRTDVPGYGWQLAHGATALTESWQAYGFVSNNHFMLGHLMEWFYAYLGGIRQTDTSVGYKELLFAPQMVGDVTWAETSLETPYGTASCR